MAKKRKGKAKGKKSSTTEEMLPDLGTVWLEAGRASCEIVLDHFDLHMLGRAGTGGAVAEGAVELQGDLRDRVRIYLTTKGFVVKG